MQTIETADGPMEVHVAEPTGTPRATVIVIQEAFGLTDHIRAVADVIAEHGYLALAPALFHRSETRVFEYDDLAGAMPVLMSLTREGIDADLDATLALAAERGFDATHVGIVGFCMGGSVTLYAAGTRSLGAAVTFYGGGVGKGRFGFPSGLELGAALRTPWLGLYGDRDGSIPIEEVEQLREVVGGSGVDAEIVRYAEGQHGFHCDDRPAVYDAEIAADARARTLAWFDAHLGA